MSKDLEHFEAIFNEADSVKSAVTALNAAIRKAAKVGLSVSLTEMEMRNIEDNLSVPQIALHMNIPVG